MTSDLEIDLSNTPWIVKKVQQNDIYAQNLYAALCNNDFRKFDVWTILKNEMWGCTWRYASSIVANLQSSDTDPNKWYCSGTFADFDAGQVPEGIITDEIRKDLEIINWYPVAE